MCVGNWFEPRILQILVDKSVNTAVMISCALVLLSLVAGDRSQANDRTPTSIDVEAVAESWQHRSEAFAQGMIRWIYASDSYGRFETYWVPIDDTMAEPINAAFRFSGNAVRYRSRSLGYPILGNIWMATNDARNYYRSALLSHFSDANAARRKWLNYEIVVNRDRVVHVWQDGSLAADQEYPRAVILPPRHIASVDSLAKATGFASDSHEHESGLPSPVMHQLSMLPLLICLRPSLFDQRFAGSWEDIQLEPPSPHDGTSCVTLRLPLPAADEGTLQWTLWLDPDVQYSVRRMIGKIAGHPRVQCDIFYEKHDAGYWVPSDWTIQILGEDPSFVQQTVSAKVTQVTIDESASSDPIATKLPLHTWVQDIVAANEVMVMEEGRRWEIPRTTTELLSHPQLVSLASGRLSSGGRGKSHREAWLLFTRWPGLAVPLIFVTAILFAAIRFGVPLLSAAPNRSNSLSAQE